MHIKSLKQALNHGLVLKKLHRIINFKQKAWLKAYIDINKELRKKTKNHFEKGFFSWWIMQFLENYRNCEKI